MVIIIIITIATTIKARLKRRRFFPRRISMRFDKAGVRVVRIKIQKRANNLKGDFTGHTLKSEVNECAYPPD